VVVVVALAVTFFYFASSLCSLLPIANLLAENPACFAAVGGSGPWDGDVGDSILRERFRVRHKQ